MPPQDTATTRDKPTTDPNRIEHQWDDTNTDHDTQTSRHSKPVANSHTYPPAPKHRGPTPPPQNHPNHLCTAASPTDDISSGPLHHTNFHQPEQEANSGNTTHPAQQPNNTNQSNDVLPETVGPLLQPHQTTHHHHDTNGLRREAPDHTGTPTTTNTAAVS
jgi:hypothetical protein